MKYLNNTHVRFYILGAIAVLALFALAGHPLISPEVMLGLGGSPARR
jgi:hypothetical protein